MMSPETPTATPFDTAEYDLELEQWERDRVRAAVGEHACQSTTALLDIFAEHEASPDNPSIILGSE